MTAALGVVIPAYRGADVLHRSMGSLASQRLEDGGLSAAQIHVVVAVNDGLPETDLAAKELAEPIRDAGMRCTVVSSAPGRALAFNRAEVELSSGVRLFLDQDAVLSANALAALARTLRPGSGTEFAALTPRICAPSSRLSRAYYRAWLSLPYVNASPVTAGCYAVSAAGRRRWGAFPRIHSDDKLTRLRFAPAERTLITDAWYEVLAPSGFTELVSARRRYLRGNRELQAIGGAGLSTDAPRHSGYLTLTTHPQNWPALGVFSAVYASAAVAELTSERRTRR